MQVVQPGMSFIGWTSYIAFCFILAGVRGQTRVAWGIPGNILQDFFASLFMYPNVVVQLLMGADDKGSMEY